MPLFLVVNIPFNNWSTIRKNEFHYMLCEITFMTLYNCKILLVHLFYFVPKNIFKVLKILNFINEYQLPSNTKRTLIYFVCFKLHSIVLKVIWKSYNKKYLKFPFISWLKIGLMLMNEGEQILNFVWNAFFISIIPGEKWKADPENEWKFL